MRNWFKCFWGSGSEQKTIKPFYLGGRLEYLNDSPWNALESVELKDPVIAHDIDCRPDCILCTTKMDVVSAYPSKGMAEGHHYIITTICGSMRYYDDMIGVAEHLTRHGQIVLMPHCVKNDEGDPINSDMLDEMHRQKIDMSDDIVVVGNYIGDSTRSEIAYATRTGKHVRYYDPRILAYYKRLRND